ncbi:MAG: hypothetical protein EAS52_15555 [Parapedobacter sp.]|nr:MAG: hypothetical protein EAS52_15555 [Parapedobacter sp.]
MARFIDLLAFSGAVGDVVGCMGPFGFYIRSRPRKSDKTPSPKQRAARSKLGMAMGFLKPLKEIIYMGFANAHRSRSKTAAMNAAASHMLNYAIEGDFPDISINPAAVRLSRGTLMQLPDVSLEQTGSEITVMWSPMLSPFSGHADDRVMVICYNLEEESVEVGEAKRQDGLLTLDLSELPVDSTSLIYVCVAERNGKQFSNSQFLGRIER